jgi:predicted Zn-dependent protease
MLPSISHIHPVRTSGPARRALLALLAVALTATGCVGGKTNSTAPPSIAESRQERAAVAQAAFAEKFDEARRVAALDLWRQGDVAGCASMLEELSARRPDDPAIRTHLAELAWLQGDLPRAEREYRAALELAPDRPDLQHALDIVLQQAGRQGQAAVSLASAADPSGS